MRQIQRLCGSLSHGKESRYKAAFTLIELLIVVAIIAILAAIAVPNFLEAQIRSKVSRARSDQRSISIALESYCVDKNQYPSAWTTNDQHYGWDYNDICLAALTTPIAYITSISTDPFKMFTDDPLFATATTSHRDQYIYWGGDLYWDMKWRVTNNPSDVAFMDAVYGSNQGNKAWILCSVGPDHFSVTPWPVAAGTTSTAFTVYDSSNGTNSLGNILRTSREANPTQR
jgi:prepilin-type N-terminal cleavage/methylation domain-containing protein